MAQRKLARYRAKRDFRRTAEPSGSAARTRAAERLRFVVQKHAARRLHFDLRLELDGVFRSWAVTKGPSLDPSVRRLAVEVEDHPLDYGDFEGTITKGEYGGGSVQLWDRGYWAPDGDDESPEQALQSGSLKFTLDGERLHGGWVLVRMKNDRYGRSGKGKSGKRTNWLLIKHREEYAHEADHDQLLVEDRSVASGRPMTQIAAGKGRSPRPFMLARKGARASKANAVWHSNKDGDTQVSKPGSNNKQAGQRRPDQRQSAQGRRPQGHPVQRSVRDIVGKRTRGRMPEFIAPQLAKLV